MATFSSALTQSGNTSDVDISSSGTVLYTLTEGANPNSYAIVSLSHFTRSSGTTSGGVVTGINIEHFDELNSVWVASISSPISIATLAASTVTSANKPAVCYSSDTDYFDHMRSARMWGGVVNYSAWIQPQASPAAAVISTGDLNNATYNTRVIPFILFPNERLITSGASSGTFISVHAREIKPGN